MIGGEGEARTTGEEGGSLRTAGKTMSTKERLSSVRIEG